MTEKLGSGKLTRIRRKLVSAIPQEIVIKNETGLELELDREENCDGSKPSLILRVKRVLARDEDPPRGVL